MAMKRLSTMSDLNKPVCASCNIKFQNMKSLDVHMKVDHEESENTRIKRLTRTVEEVRKCEILQKIKSSDCTECGILFVTSQDLKTHIKNVHNKNIEGEDQTNSKVQSLIEDMLEEVIDISQTESSASENEVDSGSDEEDINIDYQYSVEKVSCDETFKGKKPLFVQSVKAIKKLVHEKGDTNGKIKNKHKFVVKDVRDVSYGVEADIEISKGRIKGLARIKIWGPSKSSKGKQQMHNYSYKVSPL